MVIIPFVFAIFFSIESARSERNPYEDPYICGLPTCSGNGKFKYGPGTEQNYRYSVEVSSLFNGTSKNESTLFLEGDLSLVFPTSCEGVLTLYNFILKEKNSDVSENPNSQLFKDSLSAHPLRFAFKDGNIYQLCPSEQETEWVLNFKRGILNMLHNTMKRFDLDFTTDEVDVRGTCPTTYHVIGAKETSLLIEKTKDLNACQGIGRIHSFVKSATIPFYSNSARKENLLKSSSQCLLSVDHNIYNKITCEETHVFQPFSNQDTGASTSIKQELTLRQELQVQQNEEQEIYRRLPLYFDHTIPEKQTSDDLTITTELVKELCKYDKMQGGVDLSNIFSKFIYNLKTVSYVALSELNQRIGAVCTSGRRHLLNALPYVNTGPSVLLMKDIILKKAVPQSTVKDWVSSIAFIHDPTEDMLAATKELLQKTYFDHHIALGISALMRTYCAQHSSCLEENEKVYSNVLFLEKKVQESYRKNVKDRRTHDDIMVALKALSNIGTISNEFYDQLHIIIEDSHADPALRVAAIEVFRHLPCDSSRHYFENIYLNPDQDVELRIASYLQIMRCPDYMLIKTIRQSLFNEEVNQVGSFVWSHLNNLIKTAVPTKVEIQSLLSEKDLVKKFSSDVRKFSRNFDGSVYFDEYGVGGSYEGNLIFSPSSYVPKSAMINFTTVLFGESINLLEMYGRVDGFEHYLESLFGPKGTANDLKDNVMAHLRMPRSANAKNVLEEQVKKLPNVFADTAKEPKVSLGMKVFGNDLKYITLNGETEIQEAFNNLSPLHNLQKILSGKEIIYNNAAMFLDSKYIVSTGAGLPLSLSATGTAVVNLKLYGSLISSRFSGNRELELDLTANVEPTVSLDVTGEMAVDAFFASTGIKLKANMFTDTAIKSDIKIRGSKLVSAKFSLPKRNNEIINARSELTVKQNNIEERQEGHSKNLVSTKVCSWDAVEKTLGLKLCSSYSLVNVTNMENVPYFIMAGPTSFRFFIHKADPTANIYQFEYKWTPTLITATFDTPGSKVNRLFSANLTVGRGMQNLTVILRSSEGMVSLKGKVVNRPDARVLQFTVNINDEEHFDAGVSLYRTNLKNGFAYKPTIYLSVNKERIFTFKGTIDLMSKRGISQYTVDLKFETKRLHSKLFGYISTTETSLEASLYSDYKFHRTKEQRLSMKFGVANRSPKNMVVLVGFCKLNSTAYPNLNIDINGTFQRSGSHMDLTLKLKQAPFPPEHPEAAFRTLTFDSIISYKTFTDNKRTWTAEASLVKASSNLDLKGSLIYETFRHNVNIISEVKYGNDKTVSMTVLWSKPKQTLEEIKLHVNVSAPTFAPLILSVEIVEKQPKAYMIDFHGTWFSGHSMTALGFYNDKSSSISSNHHVKILIRSPSFKDTKMNVFYFRDNNIFKLLLETNYDNKDDYQLSIIHKALSNEETYFQYIVKYKSQIYRFVTTVYDGDYKKVDAEVHFDKYRDITVWCYLLNEERNKTLGFKFNWDANRDPNQKLLVTATYKKTANLNYLADVIISYPGRTIKGDYKFSLERGHLKTLTSLSWDEGRTAGLELDVLYEYERRLYLSVSSRVYTPLVNWKVTKIEGTFEHAANKYDVHGMVSWDRTHKIGLDVFGDHTSREGYFWCRYSLSIQSSTQPIPNVNITISHLQNVSNLDTNVYLMYNPEFIVAVDSYWKVDSDENYKNLTGTVQTKTPFSGLNNGALVSKIMLKNKKYLRGVADLDLNHKKVSINMDGYFKKLTDCMLIVNATSLDDHYQLNFMISTDRKHFVAMLTYPSGNLGTEILLSLSSIMDFDVKLQLATPIEFLQNVLLIAKLKSEQADFRLSWNVLALGFSGVWHYVGLTDIEYAYKIYTPLQGFEENGVVAKLIIDEGLDFEMSLQVSIYKLGLKLFGKEKPHLLKEIGVDLKELYSHSHLVDAKASADDLRWEGAIEVDAVIYPTMKGVLEVNQRGETYYLQSKLTMPHGVATLVNELYYHDIFTIKNSLHIITPYVTFKTINSNFELDVKTGKKYSLNLSMDYQNRLELIQIGADVKYETETKEIHEKSYNLSVHIKTPFKSFPKLNFIGTYESEENYYHPKLILNTVSTDVLFDGVAEMDNGLLEISADFFVMIPTIYIPPSKLRVIKHFSPIINSLEVNLNSPEILGSDISLRTSWLIKSKTDFQTFVHLETPFTGLENTTAGVNVYISNSKSTLWTTLQMNPIEIEVNSTLHKNELLAISTLILKKKKYPITVNCKIINSGKNEKKFDGKLRISGQEYNISGNAELTGALFTRTYLKFTPHDNSQPSIFEYQIDQKSMNEFDLKGYIQYMGKTDRFKAHLLAYQMIDWKFSMEIDTAKSDVFLITSEVKSANEVINMFLTANTPIKQIEHVSLNGTFNSTGIHKSLNGHLEAGSVKVIGLVISRLNFLEDMMVLASGTATNGIFNKTSSVYGLYNNPKKDFHYLCMAADIKIDTFWDGGMNTTLRLPKSETTPVSVMGLEGNFKVPNGNGEVHSFDSYLDYTKSMKHLNYLLKYKSTHFLKKYGLSGLVNIENNKNVTGTVNLEWDSSIYKNYGNMKLIEDNIDLLYKIQTPKYADKHFIVTKLKFIPLKERYNITLDGFHPEFTKVLHSTIDFAELINMKGFFNVTVPHSSFNYTGAEFNVETNDNVVNRYIKVFWQGDNAFLDSKCNIRRGQQLPDSNRQGTLTLEVPLKTRHITKVDYEYDETGQVTKGTSLVNYNGHKVLEGHYKCISESKAGIEKDTVHAELINKFMPVAADYSHKYEYGASKDDDTVDTKHIRVYHMENLSKLDVTGKLEVHNVWGGQEYTITAIHANKTVTLAADYTIFDQIFKQHSRLELSPMHWLEYEINIVNKTKDDIYDVQEATMEVTYPQRSFITKGFYNISGSIIASDISVEWDRDKKTVRGGLDWRKIGFQRDQLTVYLKHPTFEKDVTLLSEYGYGERHIDGHLIVDYSLDPDKRLTLSGKLNDKSDPSTYNYTGNLIAEHNATNLKLNSFANIFWNPTTFGNDHITKYQRSYLPVSTSETLVKVNLDNNEIELKKDVLGSGYSYFWGRYGGRYPVYVANMSTVYDDTNKYSGQFLVDFKNILMFLHMNLTDDGSQSLHMNGIVPDARSVSFQIWREYDDIMISDVGYYLKLNHSRLVTSCLKWRPDLYDGVKSTIRGGVMKFYIGTLEGINNTKHYIKSETMDAMNGIWQDAKPIVQQFLNDLKNLTIIEQDIEEFKVFLNNSYNANDFYIKDIINVTYMIFDELALKSHLQTLPKIVQELWSMMGESGEKIKKSILWAIEEIKVYYNNTTDFIHGLINGDPIEHISSGLEKLLEKYDNFIKNLHITILQYIETLWYQTYNYFVEYWHKFLASLEPTFLKLAHYVESMAWSTGRDFLDFLYLRKNEFIESPYFVKFSKLSHDVDKFYKDITGNNTFAAIYKYTKTAWDFIKEKYINGIPYGKEVLEVVNEILDELKQIGEITSVKFMLKKWTEFYDNIRYYYDYFHVENKIQKFIRVIYNKLSDLSVTALDVENRHREAKTKFIFEPNDGVMLLEQKLPMSWHAFNETPNFREIPEIERIFKFRDFFDSSKTTFWDLYYDYMTFMDPSSWFPPFKGRAMLIGSKHYVTFDKRYYDFEGTCTYLLARDFDDHNFTLLVSNDEHMKNHEIIIVLDKAIVRVNLEKNKITLGNSKVESLPVQVGDVYLYRDFGLFIMESSMGFNLECNMKYQFCTFEISGWYAGKTAGLWGTFNNEPSDDFHTANTTKQADVTLSSFVGGWSIDNKCGMKVSKSARSDQPPEEVKTLCDEFFISKVSQLSDCFGRVPKDYFYSICLNGSSKHEACMAAVSYINMCSYAHSPLRIPDTCVQCKALNGTEKKEGEFIRFEGDNLSKHADIVFIIEAKSCNRNFSQPKNFEILVDLIEKDLLLRNITNNRYAVVTFGGDGVFDEPRSIVIDGETFGNSRNILKYVDKFMMGNGSQDIFTAIMFAYNLISRPEATRSFILVPCSDCNIYNMEYDYATVHQLLSESAISLHILMADNFKMQKEGEVRVPFGIDKRYAYTKRDVRSLVGDQSLRKLIQLPKASLGQCLSLALETNGTIFSGKFLADKKNAKKFATVYSQLIARSIVPPHCMDCECTATDTGISYMECYLCTMTTTSKSNVEMLLAFEGDDLTTINLFEEFNS